MATYNGPWIATDDWRSVMEVTTTSTNTAVSFTVVGKCQSVYAYSSNWTGTLTSSVSGGTTTTTFSCSTNQTVTFKTNTFSVARGTSAKTVTVKCAVYNPNYGSTSTATASITVPALASYTVTYDANGGSGAPGSQTKWYGSTLTLSSTVPTRTNYTFLGWATSASATTATYQPGGSYTANAAAKLYAVWQLALVPPTISSVSLYRTSTATSALDEDGSYAWLSLAWAVDTTTNGSGNVGVSVSVRSRVLPDGAWATLDSIAISDTSGTVGQNLKSSSALATFSASTAYEVSLTVTDLAGATATATRSLSISFVPISVSAERQGHSIAFGRAANGSTPELGFAATLPPTFDDASAWLSALGIETGASSVSTGTWRWVKLPGGIAIAEYVDTSNRSLACTTQSGVFYYGTVSSIAFPFTFATVPTLAVSTAGGSYQYFIQCGAATTTATGQMYLNRSSSTTFNGKVHVTAIGRYE